MKIDFSKDTDRDTLNAQNNFEERVKDFLAEWVSDSETVEVQTSGSTGVPKNSRLKNPGCYARLR